MAIVLASSRWERGLLRSWMALSVLWLLTVTGTALWAGHIAYELAGMEGLRHWLAVETDWLKVVLWVVLPPAIVLLFLEMIAWVVRGFSRG